MINDALATSYFTPPTNEEMTARLNPDDPEFKHIYFNLHFIENSSFIVFINGYKNEATVYRFTNKIEFLSQTHMPDGFALSCSESLTDDKAVLIGNSMGTVHCFEAEEAKFCKDSFKLTDLTPLIKTATLPNILDFILKEAEPATSLSVTHICSHPYIKCRLAVTYAFNTIVLYDFDKQRADSIFDLNEKYIKITGKNFRNDIENIESVILDSRYSIDSCKYLVAVKAGKIFIYKNGKFWH